MCAWGSVLVIVCVQERKLWKWEANGRKRKTRTGEKRGEMSWK